MMSVKRKESGESLKAKDTWNFGKEQKAEAN